MHDVLSISRVVQHLGFLVHRNTWHRLSSTQPTHTTESNTVTTLSAKIALENSRSIMTHTATVYVLSSANGLSQFGGDRPVCPSVCLSGAHSCRELYMTAPLCRETRGLASHSSSHAYTDTQAEEGNLCVCVSVIGQAVQFVFVKAPEHREREREREGRQDGWRSGQWDIISSPLGGIQVFAGLMSRGGN